MMSIKEAKSGQLGEVTTNDRGFQKVEFTDANGEKGRITCTSVIGEYEDSYEHPGTSMLWIGLEKVEPIILAKNASAHGVITTETVGWVPYPVPDAVLLNAGLHLSREQVQGLILRLQHWLQHGDF